MVDLKGKWALVTGTSGGIGSQIALALGEQGCNLILHTRKKNKIEKLENRLKERKIDYYVVESDFSKDDDIDCMLKDIDAMQVNVDVVYNVAGVISNVLDCFAVDINDYKQIFQVNVFSIAKICNHFIPKMIMRGFGRIINVVSFVKDEPKALVYGSSKAALMKMTSEMAYAVNGTDVIISMAEPGWLKTAMGTMNAPTEVEKCVAGMLLPVLIDDGISGRIFVANPYYNCSVEEAYRLEMEAPKAIFYGEKPNSVYLPKVCGLRDFQVKYEKYINSKKKRIIFGNGNQAKFYIDVFRYLGCTIDAVICTKRPENENYLKEIPLYSIDEIPFGKDECVVLIALTEKYVRDVELQLKKDNYEVVDSYSILYTSMNWCKKDGNLVSTVYENTWNTF